MSKDEPIAILVCSNFETGETHHTRFAKSEYSDKDVDLAAEGLKEGIKDDWPNCGWAIIMNDAAKKVRVDRRLKLLGVEPGG